MVFVVYIYIYIVGYKSYVYEESNEKEREREREGGYWGRATRITHRPNTKKNKMGKRKEEED